MTPNVETFLEKGSGRNPGYMVFMNCGNLYYML